MDRRDFQDKYTRRRFLKLTVWGTGSVLLLSHCDVPETGWRFFTIAEAQLMDALANQIIPPDDWPGGKESGVTNFIDIQLTGPYTRFQKTYQRGLKAIQNSCETQFHKKFETLEWDQQTLFLEKMEAGMLKEPDWSEGFSQSFFGLIREHAMQAYYGSQRHGGNRDNMSYKMLQLDYPLIIGQNRYVN